VVFGQPRLPGTIQGLKTALQMVMLKRISEATSQSKNKEILPASEFSARTNPTLTSAPLHFCTEQFPLRP